MNLDFNLSQILLLPMTYALLFLGIFPFMFFLLVFFYKTNNKFQLYVIIHTDSFLKKSVLSNKVRNFIKSFLFLISYKINYIQNIPHKLDEIS